MPDFGRRVSRLLLLRTLVVSVVLGLSLWLLLAAEQRPARGAVWLQSAIIVVTYLSSIVFGVLLRVGVSPRKVARPMLAVDLMITSLLVYITGGAQSPFAFMYALSIVSAGALSYRRGAVVVTAASIASLLVVAGLAWLRAVDVPMSVRPWEQSAADLGRTLGIQLASMIGVGALAFIFGDQLQKGAETLATTRKAAADLFTLHQDIVRSLASGLITIAPDGTILTANDAACDILGRPVTELTNAPIDSVMPAFSERLAKGELRRADLTIADDLTIGITVSPLRDLRDQVIGRVVNFTDLTELRRLENHARRTERLATVGQLAAGVAHEIRNPLASISGSIQLLRSSPVSDDDRELMTIVHREIDRLNVLIGDLLDYANPRPSQHVDFDVDILLRETLQVARGDHAFADIEVTTNIAGPLPIRADSAKLRQVMWNLLRNAADAAAAGNKHVAVTATLGEPDDDDIRISVEDDGPGIPADKVAHIFDPFFTTKQKGTGLGLAMCHAIITEHNGRIDVESVVGRGTNMIVTLPRNRDKVAT